MKGPGWVPQDARCRQGWGRSRAAPCGAGRSAGSSAACPPLRRTGLSPLSLSICLFLSLLSGEKTGV